MDPSGPLMLNQGHEGVDDSAATTTSPLSSPGVGGGVSHVPPHNQVGPSLGLTGLAHAAGPHHGDLDEPAARSPQAVVGSGAARGGVLGDGAHVLDEAHRRCGRAAPRREGSENRSGSRGEGDPVRRRESKMDRKYQGEGRETRLSDSGSQLGWQATGRRFSLAQAPPPPRAANPRASFSRPRLRAAQRSCAPNGAESECGAP